jgi:hypothetical protein
MSCFVPMDAVVNVMVKRRGDVAIEAICEVNQELLRANREALKARSMGDD